ncbi:hypothetical protein BIY24_01825 [Halobacteriovorax marinus]|uniref:class I SAM-dependent methyltransferase n=1 Tax=Halobacteriovorax marinus TaxID=97084 RepID=UPI000BC32B1E|nr:class I SAM-dependent methyltransferase [Halobacteriovorax marinus]ATH06719.1 hypothetical protein BIY24_01825 [Halobacteriovorax marinus]
MKEINRFNLCPCCNSDRLSTFYSNPATLPLKSWKDFFYGSSKYIPNIIECVGCSYKYINTLPSSYSHFYEDRPVTQELEMRPYKTKYFKVLKRKVLKYIKLEKKENIKILDIGCGDGAWLENWNLNSTPFGLDVSTELKTFLSTIGIKQVNPEDNFHDQTFDIVTMFDFLEHLENPNDAIPLFNRYLKEEGVIILSVPNMNKITSKLLKEKYYLYCPMHFSYFTPLSLELFLKNNFPNREVLILSSPAHSTNLRGLLKWIGLNLSENSKLNIELPIGYSASSIAIVAPKNRLRS